MRVVPAIELNGKWQIQPEPSALDRPKSSQWFEVQVPAPWTSYFAPSSGVPLEAVPGRMAWYRRVFVAPAVPQNMRLLLHFDSVNSFAVLYINGKRCGEHLGDAIPFDLDITEFVTPGAETVLLVGVQDISAAEVKQPRNSIKALMYPGLSRYPGICGDVYLWLAPCLHIGGVIVRTSRLEQEAFSLQEVRVHARITVENDSDEPADFSLTSEIYEGSRQALAFAPVRGEVGPGERTELEMSITWESATLWWPDNPHLYTLRSALWWTPPDTEAEPDSVGDIIDRVNVTFGFRDFRTSGEKFLLNDVPTQIRSESLCPISGRLMSEISASDSIAPADAAEARKILSQLKRQNVNAVRFHRLPPLQALLDAADAVGMLVIVEMPLPDDERRYAVDNPKFWVNAQELIGKWVLNNIHHPSIVAWSLDQGMIRAYGRQTAEGMQSLARFVADIDSSRVIENGGDALEVNAAELGVPTTLSVLFPSTGVAFRTAGKYEPPIVRNRILPDQQPSSSPLMPDRPADLPLCMLEVAKRPLTPASLAFFLGDAAYAPGVNLADAAAPLGQIELGGLRLSGIAAIHTLGRVPSIPGMSDAAAELAALPKELFANFYAGTRLVERLHIINGTRYDQDVEITATFTTADGAQIEHSEEILMAAGAAEDKPIAFELPDVREAHAATRAASSLAEFSIKVSGSRSGSFESRRKIAIWPHVNSLGTRRLGLYDPDGKTAAALSAAGAKYNAAHGAPREEFDTIIYGEHALEHGSKIDAQALEEFTENGGLVIFLAQKVLPYDIAPVPVILDEEKQSSITFVRDADHPLMQGLSNFEMRWWQNDHIISSACIRKPAYGNFRCLADAGGPGGLKWATALEVFNGKGSYIFCQMNLAERAAQAPVAGLLLARLADAEPSWRPAEARMIAGNTLFPMVGVECPDLPQNFHAQDLRRTQVVLMSQHDLRECSAEQINALRQWLESGGTLYLHALGHQDSAALAALSGREIQFIESQQERLAFHRPGAGLARGLSSADLYFTDHAARFTGERAGRMFAIDVVARSDGDAMAVASTLNSPLEYGLFGLNVGKGLIVVDQVCWHADYGADARANRYVSTLLTNLGVRLSSRSVEPSSKCHIINISRACNATLISDIPRDDVGFTGRGPDSDLRAFSPGLILAGGVPFHIAPLRAREDRNCAVIAQSGEPACKPVKVKMKAGTLAFLVMCEGRQKRGRPIAHFTVKYNDGLETRVPIRYEIDVLDWNERPRPLEGASVAWRGFTLTGEPAAVYAKHWQNTRATVPIESVTFSSTQSGVTPIMLAMTALD